MSSVFIPTPEFPNIPVAPGVPALIREAGAIENVISSVYAVSQYINIKSDNVWGIFDSTGTPAIIADSFVGIDFRKEYRTSDYPQEPNAFSTYNKVKTPFDAAVILTCGGSIEKRAAFIKTLDAITGSLDLYSVVTPEVTYASATLERYEYGRKANNGATLIVAHVLIREIRITPSVNYASSGSQASPTDVQDPAAAATLNQGTVQAVPATPETAPYILLQAK